jgi:hypothetical protein
MGKRPMGCSGEFMNSGGKPRHSAFIMVLVKTCEDLVFGVQLFSMRLIRFTLLCSDRRDVDPPTHPLTPIRGLLQWVRVQFQFVGDLCPETDCNDCVVGVVVVVVVDLLELQTASIDGIWGDFVPKHCSPTRGETP